MQSTGHTSTQELSLVPMQGSVITYAMKKWVLVQVRRGERAILPKPRLVQLRRCFAAGNPLLRDAGEKTGSDGHTARRLRVTLTFDPGLDHASDAARHRNDTRPP